jgi:predicted amidohydrolase
MRVASIQLEIPTDEAKEARVERAARLVEAQAGVDLVVLPEIWNVGYFSFDAYAAQAEALDGPTVSRMADAARATGAWVLAGSIVERAGDLLHNTAVLLDRGGNIAATYRKIHLFGYGSREPEVLTRGREITVVETELGRFGISTCYDLRFPELYRAMLDAGAEAFLVPSAWPHPRVEAWMLLNRVRALENQCWLISANCTGGPGAGYCGRSAVVDPWGTAIAAAGVPAAVVTAEVDRDLVHSARRQFRQLDDRVLGREGAGGTGGTEVAP